MNFWGCASVKEAAKGAIGISTKDIEDARRSAIKKEFKRGYDECYADSLTVLKDIGAYVYAKNKRMIAIYVSEEDTTAAGIFFTGVDDHNTEVEVSSGSSHAKEFIAEKLFSGLDPEKKSGKHARVNFIEN